MFKWLESRALWGFLLILAGIVFLLQNLFDFELGGLFWTALVGFAGLFFLTIYLNNRANWWSLIPGFTLLGVAATILSSTYFPSVGDFLGGVFVLGGIGLAFLVIYLTERKYWWALIPAGVMFTLCLVVLGDNIIGGLGGGFLFFGLGLTFLVLALLPTANGRMTWAWYPAIALLVIGVIISAAAEDLFGYIWPAALIVGGIALIARTILSR
jgi:hypothetical protein